MRGLLCLPSSIAVRAFATASYASAVRTIDDSLRSVGLHDDKIYQSNSVFCGNVTLCRLTCSPDERFQSCVEPLRDIQLGEFFVTRLRLVECDEVCSADSRVVHAAFHLRG